MTVPTALYALTYDAHESSGDVSHFVRIVYSDNKPKPSLTWLVDIGSLKFGCSNGDQYVVLLGVLEDEIGRQKVF